SSFSTLITSLKGPNLPVTEGINDDGFTMLDQYSSSIRRKHEKDAPGSGLSDKISLGIESVGSIKQFNLSLGSKDKKKDSEKDRNVEKEKQEKFNEKIRFEEDRKPPETIIYSEKPSNEKQDLNEKELPKRKDNAALPSPSVFVEGFSWNRKPQKEKDSPHIKY